MDSKKILNVLESRSSTVSLPNILQNSKAASGGERDLAFLKYLIDNKLLIQSEAVLKRKSIGIEEEYYLDRYKKMSYESDRHFLCRTIIQEELKEKGIETYESIDIGNMDILRSNSNYDIVTKDFDSIIDIGLTPARNFFRGLTDFRVKNYLLTTYFDDYMDDIIFGVFFRHDDENFINAVRDYADGFKSYIPHTQSYDENIKYY